MANDDDILFEDLHRRSQRFSPTADKRKAFAMHGALFPQQEEFVRDTARFKSLLCPRRAGKSFSAAVYLITTCLLKPGAKTVFATLTQKSARGIIWGLLKQLDKYWEFNASFHNTNVTMTFPNGSAIQLAGADSRAEIDKFRGQAYDLFILDECKSFPPRVITELVDQVVTPAMSDCLGTMCLMGTPGNVLKGVFYDATSGASGIKGRQDVDDEGNVKELDEWSFHKWTTRDNVKMPHIYPDQLKLKARKGWGDENPIWRREYCGQWVTDHDAFVYKFDPRRNVWEFDTESRNDYGLPEGHDWQYVLGCDFGWEDPFAVVIAAYSETHPCMFEVYSFKERHMHVADIARKIAELEDEFGEFAAAVGDSGGMGKMVIEELNSIYGIAIEAAEKQQKRDYIEMFNSDLIEGRILVREDSEVVDEWSALTWKDADRDGINREIENKATPNHLADSFLYLWRYCFHHFFEAREIAPEYGTPEYWKMKSYEAMQEAIQRRHAARVEEDSWMEGLDDELGYSADEDDDPLQLEDQGVYW